MDYITQKFAWILHKITLELKYAKEQLSALREDLKNHADTIAAAYKSTQSNKEPEVKTPAGISIPDGVETHKSTEDKTDDAQYQRRSLTVQWLTFWVVFAYATIAALQWCEMKKATDASQQAAVAATSGARRLLKKTATLVLQIS